MDNLNRLYTQYKDIIPYGIFGVCTTLVNIAVYWFFAHPLGKGTMFSTVLAWIVSVTFAYLTNRKWVFHSQVQDSIEIIKEILIFYAARLATGITDWVCMFVFVDVLNINDIVIKAVSNILVIILNYIASKFFIFRKQN